MPPTPPAADFDRWVELLGRAQLRQRARRHLLRCGSATVPALRRGLHHNDPAVRGACAALLDNLLDDDAVPDLVAALDDDDPGVLGRALHALACDACKQNECRPADDLFVPRAFELLRTHPDLGVQAKAIDALGRVGRRRPDVAVALAEAGATLRHPGMRNLAARHSAPGLRRLRATATP